MALIRNWIALALPSACPCCPDFLCGVLTEWMMPAFLHGVRKSAPVNSVPPSVLTVIPLLIMLFGMVIPACWANDTNPFHEFWAVWLGPVVM